MEDDPNDVLLTQRAFRRANIVNPLQVVQDGEVAVLYLDGQGPLPTLMLLDLKLPRLSGLEVLEWLEQQPELKRLPVVVLTSSRENADVNRAYDLGANSYLVKPVAFNNLLEMVRSLNEYWLILNEKPIVQSG